VELIPADQPVICPVDDTTPQHKGKKVYGKGCHHDACRSTHSHVVWVWGHKWVTLAMGVPKNPGKCIIRVLGWRSRLFTFLEISHGTAFGDGQGTVY
jgi:hypothetical protein